jgi:hypothetical protein
MTDTHLLAGHSPPRVASPGERYIRRRGTCLANASSGNHGRLPADAVVGGTLAVLAAGDSTRLAQAMVLLLQSLIVPVTMLVSSGGH